MIAGITAWVSRFRRTEKRHCTRSSPDADMMSLGSQWNSYPRVEYGSQWVGCDKAPSLKVHCIIALASAMTSKPNGHAVEHTRRVFVEFPYNVLRSRMSGYPESRQRTNLRHHSGVMSYGVSVRHSPL